MLLADDSARAVRQQMFFLRRFLHRGATFLEIGPGDCSLSLEVAKFVERVYAVDVSAVATKNPVCPDNLAIIIYDGINIPIEHNTVNISYSNSVMEHLHPDDALAQLHSVYNALAPGGLYICTTPNRLYGPTDISKYFDDTPTGFHLKEYTVTDLSHLMRRAGFSKVRAYAGGRGLFYVPVPSPTVALCEMLLGLLPHAPRRAIAGTPPLRALLGVRLVATK
jgi:SAM-dependent methyltransferase